MFAKLRIDTSGPPSDVLKRILLLSKSTLFLRLRTEFLEKTGGFFGVSPQENPATAIVRPLAPPCLHEDGTTFSSVRGSRSPLRV